MRQLRAEFLLILLTLTLPQSHVRGDVKGGEPKVLVSRPQLAVIWLGDRRPYIRWLIRLTPEELVGSVSPSSTSTFTWTAETGKVRALRLGNGEMFAVHPKLHRFARYDEVSGTYVDDVDTRGDESEALKTITEIAEGTGATADEASKDALRNALRMAIGVVVDEEVLIQKEDVISDKVLTYSDGFISSYKELSRKSDKGIVRVKVAAKIEHRKLLADLRKANINLRTVDGKDLAVTALSRKEARENATALLSRKLSELPNLIDVNVRPPGALDYDAEKQVLSLVVDVRVNQEKYHEYLHSFRPLAEKIALAKSSVVLQVQPTFGLGDHLLDWSRGVLGPPLRFGPDLQQIPKSWCLWMVCHCDQNVQVARFTAYALDTDFAESFRPLQGTLQARIQLLDGGGGVIHEDFFDPTPTMQRESYWLGHVAGRPRPYPSPLASGTDTAKTPDRLTSLFSATQKGFSVGDENTINAYIAPVFVAGLQNGNILYSKGTWQPRTIKIAPADLKRMKEIKGSIVFKPAKADSNSKK
jgi:hypothetical protein